MFKATVFVIAVGSVAMLFGGGAYALTLAPVKPLPVINSYIELVRDGCGRGYYFSPYWRRCVEARDNDRGYYEPRYSEEDCRHDCREKHADCNWRRGGYFNGCGIAYNSCLAACR